MQAFIYDSFLRVKRSVEELSESKGIIYLNRSLVYSFQTIAYHRRIHDMSCPERYLEKIRICLQGSNGVSRNHAKLTFNDEEFWLEDVGSKNGTKCNGTMIQKHKPVRIYEGNSFFLGPIELELCSEEMVKEVPHYLIEDLPVLNVEKILATRLID